MSESSRDHTEVELKLRLNEEADYERLRACLGPPVETVEQVNHYFEAAGDGLRAAGAMLRVREGDGPPTVTLKVRARLAEGVLEAREVEASLDAGTWEEIRLGARGMESLDVAPVRVAVDLLGSPARLEVQGTMRNRRERHTMGGRVLELDRTELPDGTRDFEVEVETDDPADTRQAVEALLRSCGAGWTEQTQSKYQRFLEHLPVGGGRDL